MDGKDFQRGVIFKVTSFGIEIQMLCFMCFHTKSELVVLPFFHVLQNKKKIKKKRGSQSPFKKIANKVHDFNCSSQQMAMPYILGEIFFFVFIYGSLYGINRNTTQKYLKYKKRK